MQRIAGLLGIDGACDYDLVHDPDDDELTLWVGDLLVARRPRAARTHIEHLASTPTGETRVVSLPSLADRTVVFNLIVEDGLFCLYDAEGHLLAGLDDAAEVTSFLAGAASGGGLV